MTSTNRIARAAAMAACLTVSIGPSAIADGEPSAIADGATVLAEVNGEAVTLSQLRRLVRDIRAEAREAGQPAPDIVPSDLLQRLINLRLVFQESRTIGFDGLPEFSKAVEAFRTDTLRGMLLNRVMTDAPAPTAEAVAGRYRELAIEYRISSALFPDAASARSFRDAVVDADTFDAAAASAGESGVAERIQVAAWIPARELAAEVAAVVAALADGEISEPFAFGSGFAVVRRSETRVPDDDELHDRAQREAASAARSEALDTFLARLRGEHISIDQELLEGLDFDGAVEDFDRFLGDERVVANIDDAEPVTVAQIAAALKKRMFHGVEQAAEKGRLNRSKGNVVEELTTERALQAEARRRGLDRLPEFVEDLGDHENRVLFGMFVRRVVDRDVQVNWEEVQAYYREHLDEFTDPGMVRLESLAFADGDDARRALDRLNAGADLAWMRDNASGQVAAADLPQDAAFDGRLLLNEVLADDVADAIAGANPGDYRLWVDSAGHHHVLRVAERVAPRPRPIEQVQNEIAGRIQVEQRRAALDGWFAKLREASDIEVLVDDAALRTMLDVAAPKAG